MKEFKMLAKTLFGLEDVLAKELIELGANNVQIFRRAVSFTGNLELMYKANLCCRTALRILKPIASFKAASADEVYEEVKKIDWTEYLDLKKTFTIDSTIYSETFKHSKFVTYRVKDAIADQFVEKYSRRPSVSIDKPDLYINVHISHKDCTVSLDSSGESLHKRGYRVHQTEAPMSEVLAAGMLLMAGWKGQSNFVDPMCGSGTLLIEAALIALNIPPCIYRSSFAFEKWNDFDRDLFDEIYNDDTKECAFQYKIYGSDMSASAIKICEENVKSAGLSKFIELKKMPISEFEPIDGKCLMVTNPPYGERLEVEKLEALYQELGSLLKHKFTGNTAWVISSQENCLARIGLKPSQKVELVNGALECEYWKFEIFAGKRKNFMENKFRRPKS